MSKIITLLLDGDIKPTHELKEQLGSSYVIAADGGIRHAQALGLNVDLWIGDFDSIDDTISTLYASTKRITHPSEKNHSDGELALQTALDLKPEKIIICGATGGPRTDHVMFNLLGILNRAISHPKTIIKMTNGYEDAYPIIPKQDLIIDAPKQATISIVPLSALNDLTLKGVKWPLISVDIDMGSSHTLSNVALSTIHIHLGHGHAIAIVQTNR